MQVLTLGGFCDKGGLLPSCVKHDKYPVTLSISSFILLLIGTKLRVEPHPFPLAVAGGQCRGEIIRIIGIWLTP